MRSAKSNRKITVDGVDLCWCKTHISYLPCDKFYIRPRTHTGFDYSCSECTKTKSYEARNKRKPDNTIDEKTAAHNLLRGMGYDPDSEIPVYKQFQLKYNERIRT
jgi:hypothetical protein